MTTAAGERIEVVVRFEPLGLPVVGVPKTIDNDLPLTDCCPGFGSVAKYVATSIREAGYDVASMARTSTSIVLTVSQSRSSAGAK